MRGRPVSTHCAHCGVKFDEGENAKVDQRAICVKCEVLRKWEMNHKSRHPDSPVPPPPPPRAPQRPRVKRGGPDVYHGDLDEESGSGLVPRAPSDADGTRLAGHELQGTGHEPRPPRYGARPEEFGPRYGFSGAGEIWTKDGVRYGPVRKS